MILSSQVLSSPKCCRIDLTCSRANLSLKRIMKSKLGNGRWEVQSGRAIKVPLSMSQMSLLIFFLPFYLREELCLKDASGLQCFRNLSSEQKSSLGQVYQYVPHNLTKVHATAHFLISVRTHISMTHNTINIHVDLHPLRFIRI